MTRTAAIQGKGKAAIAPSGKTGKAGKGKGKLALQPPEQEERQMEVEPSSPERGSLMGGKGKGFMVPQRPESKGKGPVGRQRKDTGRIAKRKDKNREKKELILGITKPAVRRLARRGGVKRMANDVYDYARQVLSEFLDETVSKAVVMAELSKRRTVKAIDVIHALRTSNMHLLGQQTKNNELDKSRK